MSALTTIARPYAKAIFEQALAEKNLAEWSRCLFVLAEAVLTPEATRFINNPASTPSVQVELLQAVVNTKNKSLDNLIRLLAKNKRMMILPEITLLYEAYKAEQEKTLSIDVSSFSALSKEQEQKISESLSQRLERKVSLRVNIDPSLLGGAVFRAGDLVIDGSIVGKLNKLYAELTAQTL